MDNLRSSLVPTVIGRPTVVSVHMIFIHVFSRSNRYLVRRGQFSYGELNYSTAPVP